MSVAELVERDTRAQGLPLRLNDPDTLARVAAIVAQAGKAAGRSRRAESARVRRIATVIGASGNGERRASTRRPAIEEEATRVDTTDGVRT
ncbi:MAG: hypothetical protein H0W96_07935 [Solirubrobacterales bacterium]|nr:hypothetical protein [Solirubrobacterales bacterium]